MLNHITIMGRLTRDPELRRTGSGVAVTSFTIACDRDITNKDTGTRDVDFVDCVAWRGSAEFVNKYFQKGSMAIIAGRLQIRDWTDKDGNKRRSAEIVAENVYFGDAKKSADQVVVPIAPTELGGVHIPPAQDFTVLDDNDAQLPF